MGITPTGDPFWSSQTWWPWGPNNDWNSILPYTPEPFYYQTTTTSPCTHCWCDEETRGSREVLHERCCKCQDVRLPVEKEE